MEGYELLIKVPIVGTPSPDGVRDTDELFMRSIDGLVDELLEARKLDCLRLPADRRGEWADIVTERALALPGVAARLF